MRVLLLEDDNMIGDGLCRALAAEGMSVDWVRNGAEGEIALRDTAYAIVLLDLGLPDAEGADLLKAVRSGALTLQYSSLPPAMVSTNEYQALISERTTIWSNPSRCANSSQG